MRFLARSIKTNDLFSRYPRKISLLKDLAEGISLPERLVGPAKKTLSTVQNMENKGSEFFLPCRSMVLKLVTGKIF
jgi:hypothetical protein